jgi:hypothetical protein
MPALADDQLVPLLERVLSRLDAVEQRLASFGPKGLYDLDEAGAYLGISRSEIKRLISNGARCARSRSADGGSCRRWRSRSSSPSGWSVERTTPCRATRVVPRG